MILSFILAYFLTNALEFFPFHFFLRKPVTKSIPFLVLINSITLPLMWLLLPFFYSHFLIAFLAAEALVVLAETVLIQVLLRETLLRFFKVSLAMNVVSAGVGFVLF